MVALPRIDLRLVDASRGLWGAQIPLHVPSDRLAAWAQAGGVQVVSYDPSTGSLVLQGPAPSPPQVTYAPARRYVPPATAKASTARSAPVTVYPSRLYVLFRARPRPGGGCRTGRPPAR